MSASADQVREYLRKNGKQKKLDQIFEVEREGKGKVVYSLSQYTKTETR